MPSHNELGGLRTLLNRTESQISLLGWNRADFLFLFLAISTLRLWWTEANTSRITGNSSSEQLTNKFLLSNREASQGPNNDLRRVESLLSPRTEFSDQKSDRLFLLSFVSWANPIPSWTAPSPKPGNPEEGEASWSLVIQICHSCLKF